MPVCAANSGEKGEGGERGFPPEGVLVVVPRRTSTQTSARLRWCLVSTSVWLFKPRSHGRKMEATRARNGAPLPRWLPSFRLPHRSASSALCPCGHAASFRRRASSFVRGVWCLGIRRRCFRWRCYASARGVRGVQGGVLARGAALRLWLLLRRHVRCDSYGDGRAWRGGCARGGCVVRALGAMEGRGWLPVVGAGGVRAGPLFLCSRCR